MVEIYAVLAPNGTPPAVVEKLADAFRKAMLTPNFKNFVRNAYLYVENPLTGEELRDYLQKEYVKAGEIIRRAKLSK